jgi:hypothetical protein
MLSLLFSAAAIASSLPSPDTRLIQIQINVDVTEIPADKLVNVYIPVAQDASRQTVTKTDIDSNIKGAIKTETVHGNQYWHGQTSSVDDGRITITLTQTVQRTTKGRSSPTEAEKALYLKPNSRVFVSGPLVQKAISSMPDHDGTPMGITRSIYDTVIDTMEYKKTGNGWGNGDTEWACTEKYGNCTDFHAMFTSMARAQKVPARFEIGYPIPLDKESGVIGGYHCWLELALPEKGWFPIDASEAKKHPENRESLFGSQPLDRVQFTVGRDMTLEGQNSPPLNYFIYPHIEVDGQKWTNVTSTVRFSTPPPQPTP